MVILSSFFSSYTSAKERALRTANQYPEVSAFSSVIPVDRRNRVHLLNESVSAMLKWRDRAVELAASNILGLGVNAKCFVCVCVCVSVLGVYFFPWNCTYEREFAHNAKNINTHTHGHERSHTSKF